MFGTCLVFCVHVWYFLGKTGKSRNNKEFREKSTTTPRKNSEHPTKSLFSNVKILFSYPQSLRAIRFLILKGVALPPWPRWNLPKMFVNILIVLVHALLESICCVPPYKCPPIMRTLMPNPIEGGEHCDPLIILIRPLVCIEPLWVLLVWTSLPVWRLRGPLDPQQTLKTREITPWTD